MTTAKGLYASVPLPAYAVTQPANPVAPASTSAFKMQGLGGLITPAVSGIIRVRYDFVLVNSGTTTVGIGIALQGYYQAVQNGVAIPANAGSIPSGAQSIGPQYKWATGVTLTTAADLFEAGSMETLVGGLTVGQQYWFDLAAESVVTASIISLTNVQVLLQEVT